MLTTTKYYDFGGQRIAVRQGVGPNQTLSYLHSDHLGSTSVTTGNSGAKTNDVRYFAYGGQRSGNLLALPTDHTFTGQKLDRGSGLLYYGARYYDNALGTFISPDPIVPNSDNPQDLNRYSYTRNNPLKYRDPSGHWAETVFDIAMIGWGIAEVRRDPSLLNWGALAVDVAAAVIPVVPAGAGLIARGGKAAKAAVEVASHADEVVDAAKAVSKVEDMHHARSSAEVAQSVLRKIDPGRFNPGARFGRAFYVAQEGATAMAEIAAHGGEASHVIRYQADLSKAKVLDLTNAGIAKAWGYVEDAGAYSTHQNLARRAMEQGYNAIKYNSYRGPGFDYAFLDNPLNPFNFDEWLIPQMVSPVP